MYVIGFGRVRARLGVLAVVEGVGVEEVGVGVGVEEPLVGLDGWEGKGVREGDGEGECDGEDGGGYVIALAFVLVLPGTLPSASFPLPPPSAESAPPPPPLLIPPLILRS